MVDSFTPLATPEGQPVEGFFGKDRIHLAPAGYQRWAKEIGVVLTKLGVE